MLNEFHYEKDGTIHIEEIFHFIISHASSEKLLEAKLLYFMRKLEIEGMNTLTHFTFHLSIDRNMYFFFPIILIQGNFTFNNL
jgi:hypothetical protein